MSEEVKDENDSQSAKVIEEIKAAKSFGPFNTQTRSGGKCYLQWQKLTVENIDFHYEVIIGKNAVNGNSNTIYAEFHIERANTELPQSLQTDVENLKNEEIKCFPRYSNPDRGLAIRWGDGVDVQNETSDTVKELSDQMKALHTAIDGVVSQHLIKYIFKDLIDNSDSSAEKFLIAFNDRIYKFYNENNKDANVSEKASYLLVRLLEQVHEQYPQWRLPFGKKGAENLFGEKDAETLLDNSDTIPVKEFIEKIKNEKFLISPFSFWSIFFSHNNKFATLQRPSVLSSLLDALRGDESNRKNIVQSLIDLRVAKARLLSKQKKGEEKDDLTIEGWTQLVAELSKYAPTCWQLFEEVMSDNPDKDTINGYIQDIITNKKNGENVKRGCDRVGKEAVPNILPFIRPDLKFYFDNKGNVTNIIRSEEMEIKNTIKLLESSKQIILTGAPGTGKTYHATKVAEKMILDARTEEEKAKIEEKYKEKLTEEEKELFKKVQFHPGYDYSDFIIGLKPKVAPDGKTVTFEWKDGVFKEFADNALKAYIDAKGVEAKPYIFIIDEINRADLSRVFGEVFSLLEEDYRYPNKEKGITLPNGKDFILSPNLYIIGTMNDIDRSVESMDFALRRRFSWKEVTAEESAHIIDAKDKNTDKEKIEKPKNREALTRAMAELNKYIGGEEQEKEKLKVNEQPVSLNLGKEYQLGGAYFLNFAKYQKESNPFDSLWNNHIAIILNEYLRGHRFRSEIVKTLKGKYEAALKGQNEAENPDATTAVPPTQEQSDGVQQ